MDESTLEIFCGMAIKLVTENSIEFEKKWGAIAEFGNPIEQYNAIRFSEWICEKRKVIRENLDLIESIRIFNNDSIETKVYDNSVLYV